MNLESGGRGRAEVASVVGMAVSGYALAALCIYAECAHVALFALVFVVTVLGAWTLMAEIDRRSIEPRRIPRVHMALTILLGQASTALSVVGVSIGVLALAAAGAVGVVLALGGLRLCAVADLDSDRWWTEMLESLGFLSVATLAVFVCVGLDRMERRAVGLSTLGVVTGVGATLWARARLARLTTTDDHVPTAARCSSPIRRDP
jgi:hypothetical protein